MRNSESPATPTSDIAVEISHVSKSFRQRQRPGSLGETIRSFTRPTFKTITALRDLSLQVSRGEVLAYAGPNGAGKSTSIKLLAGIIGPDEGTVRSLGVDPRKDRVSYVGRVAVIFGQRTELWWDHSVEASFRWKKAMWRISDRDFETRIRELRERFELAPIWQTLARELSLGQRMRADLALGLLHGPELILLDEPTLGLDVVARQRMLEFVGDLNRRDGATVIITSHNMSDLEQLAGRIVLIHKGQLRFDGDFDQLRATVDDIRQITVELAQSREVPQLRGANLVKSQGTRHTFSFNAGEVPVGFLLDQLSPLQVVDIQTSRASIDNVVNDVYANLGRTGDSHNEASKTYK